MSSSGRSRRSQIDSSSVASSDGFGDDNLSIDVERDEVKRKSRNLSEKKRRDQFNMLINELCSMVNLDPSEDIGSSGNKKMDKSSVLRATITFLKNHTEETKHHANEIGEDNCQPDNSASSGFINSWKPSFLSTEEFSHLSLEVFAVMSKILNLNARPLTRSRTKKLISTVGLTTTIEKVIDINEPSGSGLHKVPKSSKSKNLRKGPFIEPDSDDEETVENESRNTFTASEEIVWDYSGAVKEGYLPGKPRTDKYLRVELQSANFLVHPSKCKNLPHDLPKGNKDWEKLIDCEDPASWPDSKPCPYRCRWCGRQYSAKKNQYRHEKECIARGKTEWVPDVDYRIGNKLGTLGRKKKATD